jgi:phage terminase small subunit
MEVSVKMGCLDRDGNITPGHGLTERQKRFVDAYIRTGNAVQSAIEAGYSEDYAQTSGHKILQNKYVAERLKQRLDKMDSEKIASAQEVLEYLTKVMRGESESVVVVVKSTGEGCSEVEHVTKKPSEPEQLKAAELLGKRHGLYIDRKDVTTNGQAMLPLIYLPENGKGKRTDKPQEDKR